MAVTKIKPIKGTLNKALDYIQNPAKTDEKMLVSSFGCSYETADIEFAFCSISAVSFAPLTESATTFSLISSCNVYRSSFPDSDSVLLGVKKGRPFFTPPC